MEFSRPEYWSGWPFFSPGVLPNPGMEPRSSTLQVDSLPAEPQEKPKNIGVGSPSLLQQIFLTQDSNWGLLPCRWILYQLNYQGSPNSAPVSKALDSPTSIASLCSCICCLMFQPNKSVCWALPGDLNTPFSLHNVCYAFRSLFNVCLPTWM